MMKTSKTAEEVAVFFATKRVFLVKTKWLDDSKRLRHQQIATNEATCKIISDETILNNILSVVLATLKECTIGRMPKTGSVAMGWCS